MGKLYFAPIVNRWSTTSLAISDIKSQLVLTFPLSIWTLESDSHRSQYLLVSFLKLNLHSVIWYDVCGFSSSTLIKIYAKIWAYLLKNHICSQQTTKTPDLSHHLVLIKSSLLFFTYMGAMVSPSCPQAEQKSNSLYFVNISMDVWYIDLLMSCVKDALLCASSRECSMKCLKEILFPGILSQALWPGSCFF